MVKVAGHVLDSLMRRIVGESKYKALQHQRFTDSMASQMLDLLLKTSNQILTPEEYAVFSRRIGFSPEVEQQRSIGDIAIELGITAGDAIILYEAGVNKLRSSQWVAEINQLAKQTSVLEGSTLSSISAVASDRATAVI